MGVSSRAGPGVVVNAWCQLEREVGEMLANQFFPKSVNKDPGKFIYFEQDVRASPASLELPRPCVASSWIVGHFIFGGEGLVYCIGKENNM